MRRTRLLFLLECLLLPWVAKAGERMADLALVLLTDVSRSMDAAEYDLMKQGYAAALTDPRVLAAITGGPQGAIALLDVGFAGASEVRTLVEWAVVSDAPQSRRLPPRCNTRRAPSGAAPRSRPGSSIPWRPWLAACRRRASRQTGW